MLTFLQYIFESGDFHYQYHKTDAPKSNYGDSSHRYTFKDDNNQTKHVDIVHHSYYDYPTADVHFHNHEQEHSDDGKYTADGNSGRKAIKVFSTIKHILKSHSKNHPNVKQYDFESSHSEPSRVKLYTKLTTSHDGVSQEDNGLTHHRIKADKL